MASATATEEIKSAAPKKAGSPLPAIVAAVVLSIGASTGASFMLTRHQLAAKAAGDVAEHEGEAKPAEKKAPPNYVPLDPAFVVNLEGDDTRFLQVQVQMMTRDAHAPDVIKAHEPRIRNALLMLFSQQRPQDIADRAGKEKLQAGVLAEIQKILTDETGQPTVEAVYFTSFVTQ